jgi:type III pantothenate kinase
VKDKIMLLAIDIGNTQVVMGIFEEEKLLFTWRIATSAQRTADECWAQVLAMCQAYKFQVEWLREVAISSVAPEVTASFKRMVQDHIAGVEPFIFEPGEYQGIKIGYDNPRAVGADRICNAVAGYHHFGGPLIVVDFGTATTFDVVDGNGDYLGGAIAPGLETGSAELHRRAAKLVKVDLKYPDNAIGHSTESSMQAGIMFGVLDMVDGMVRRIWRELDTECLVVATGGLALLIAPKSQTITHVLPNLVLEGLNIIYHQMRK